MLDFFTSLSDAMMVITTWVINLAPVGVFFLIGGQVLGTQDFGVVLNQLGWYFSTVMIGLFMHGFIVLPLIFTVVTRTLPFRFIANMTNAFTTAFGSYTIIISADINMIDIQELPLAAPPSLSPLDCWRTGTRWTPGSAGSYYPSAPPSTWTGLLSTRPWPPSSLPKSTTST